MLIQVVLQEKLITTRTIRKTNLEAAAEIARQIRLRDLSGVIVGRFYRYG